MDYILTHDWLLFPVIGYLSLVIMKWLYVVRGMPHLFKSLREMRPEWPKPLHWFLTIWLPALMLPISVVVFPFAWSMEKKNFFKPYPKEEMWEWAKDMANFDKSRAPID